MRRMGVVVRTMIAGVIVVMNRGFSMGMPMFVLVAMLVVMCVAVLVGVQMLVLVVALHG